MAGGGSLGAAQGGMGGGQRTPPIWQGGGGQIGGMTGKGAPPMGGPPVMEDAGTSFGGGPMQAPGVGLPSSIGAGDAGQVVPPSGQPVGIPPSGGGVVGVPGMGTAPQPSMPMPPPSMPAGLPPPQQPGVSGSVMNATGGRLGGAQVNSKPAQVGMSSSQDATAAMQRRAGVNPMQPYSGQVSQPGMPPKKQYPMPAVPPKPGA